MNNQEAWKIIEERLPVQFESEVMRQIKEGEAPLDALRKTVEQVHLSTFPEHMMDELAEIVYIQYRCRGFSHTVSETQKLAVIAIKDHSECIPFLKRGYSPTKALLFGLASKRCIHTQWSELERHAFDEEEKKAKEESSLDPNLSNLVEDLVKKKFSYQIAVEEAKAQILIGKLPPDIQQCVEKKLKTNQFGRLAQEVVISVCEEAIKEGHSFFNNTIIQKWELQGFPAVIPML